MNMLSLTQTLVQDLRKSSLLIAVGVAIAVGKQVITHGSPEFLELATVAGEVSWECDFDYGGTLVCVR